MDVKNCKNCGRIFNYAGGQMICAQCKKELEVKFKEVKYYIRRNPQSSMQIVSEECSVDIKQIKHWIREERLSFSDNSDIGIECEKCGKNIKTGRYCDECKVDMIKELSGARRPQNGNPIDRIPMRDDKGTGMHFRKTDR